jgi:uncharacterized damage-inducible protein DinB
MELVSRGALIETLLFANRRVSDWFTAVPATDFFIRSGSAWSASDNLDHLIKIVRPITRALKLPRLALQGMFGKSERPSRGYEEICEIYRSEIKKGAHASGRYLPDQESPGDKNDLRKVDLIRQWEKASAELVAAAEEWTEADLDACQIPHPILGKLTVREILFFTIYHNLRHSSEQGD